MGVWQFGRARRASVKGKKKEPLGAALARRTSSLNIEPLEQRLLFSIAPTFVSFITNIPNDGAFLNTDPNQPSTALTQAPQQLIIKFSDGQIIDPSTLAAGIHIVRAGGDGVIGNANDISLAPLPSNPNPNQSYDYYEGIPEQSNQVVIRFQNTLPDDTYKIYVTSDLKNTAGQALSNPSAASAKFTLNYGAQVTAVVPQPITRNAQGVLTQATNQIQVYFTNDILKTIGSTNTLDPTLFQLIFTGSSGGTATTNDDVTYNPTSVTYDAAKNMATLKFGTDASPIPLDQLGSGPGTYRLRIGDNATNGGTLNIAVAPGQAGSMFSNAFGVGQIDATNTLTSQSVVITGAAIQAPGSSALNNAAYNLLWPGAKTDPGQRNLPAPTSNDVPDTGTNPAVDTIVGQNHFYDSPNVDPTSGLSPQATFGADSTPGISRLFYNFRTIYGTDPNGNPLINQITPQQMQDVRDIFTLWGHYLGVQFVETASLGLTVATGDPRAVASSIPVTSLNGIEGLSTIINSDNSTTTIPVAVVNNLTDWGASEYGGAYFQTAMQQIGHYLGLNQSFDLPGLQAMGSTGAATDSAGNAITNAPEPVLPGSFDILDGQHLYRPESKDINVYSFSLQHSGMFSAEVVAQRTPVNSLLNSVVTLYDSSGKMIARNDDYFGADSFVNLLLDPGQYYVAVTSTGNTNFNPNVPDSGGGGTTQGAYNLRLSFSPIPPDKQLMDVGGQPLDGDLDGVAGGDFNFWFQVGNANNTKFVDKSATGNGSGALGSLTNPYNNLQTVLNAAVAGDIIRIVGNGGTDGVVSTLGDDKAYEIGRDIFGNPLSDGSTFNVPKGVTVMIDAGAIFKLRGANMNAGSFAQGVDLAGGAIQVLGTPQQSAYFTSDNNQAIGVDTNPLQTTPALGDWGGLVFQNDSDFEKNGVFLNYVAHADIAYGGGPVNVDGQQQVYDPIHMITSRPTILSNFIHDNADAAMSADPDSFEYSLFRDSAPGVGPISSNLLYTADYSRAGPLVHGNVLVRDSINGLFIRIRTNAGAPVDVLDVTARLTATDVVYVLSQNLLIQGEPGGAVVLDANGNISDPGAPGATQVARLSQGGGVGGLIIDPGVIIKSNGSRIEVGVGGQLIAEGTSAKPITFTSLFDNTFGAGGVFATTSNFSSVGAAGDWAGIFFNPVSTGSFDHVLITNAGGISAIEGGFAHFNAVEIYQATVRIVDSIIENNASGADATNRNGRGATAAAAIYVIGAQPVIVNNIIRNNVGDVISISANSLNAQNLPDWGRSTGRLNRFTQFDDNYGPLVRMNVIQNNTTNGMEVRGATLDTESIWDDVDITHVLLSNIDIPNFESTGGLELKSSPTQSLIVKLAGQTAGFTADGKPLDISNRIGGTLIIMGTPGHPVVLTSLGDNSIGAGLDLSGNVVTTTIGAAPSLAIQFQFDSSVPASARTALQEAAAAWSAVIHTPITISIDISFAHLGAGILGQTGSVTAALDYDQVRARLIANAQADDAYLNLLPTFAQLQTSLPDSSFTVSRTMSVNRAEALALGFNAALLPKQVSTVDGSTLVDGTMEFSLDFPFDYNRADGISSNSTDFVAVAIHELGHALGFTSAIDSQVIPGITTVNLHPMDLFRVAPGTGATDFTNTPRILQDTAPGTQVFYDGGQFNNPALMVPGSTAGDIPLSTGSDFQASHWLFRGDIPSATPIGIMDPVIFNGGNITQADIRAMEVMGWNTSNVAASGAWKGLTLTQYANDRNVALVNELENSYTGSTGDTNGTPFKSQPLGSIAPDLLNGDENLRLGFEVHGSISYDNSSDQDVYAFKGNAGTQVWLQISDTSPALDTVLELIDSNGVVLATSDNAPAEIMNPALLASENAGKTTIINPLTLGAYSGGIQNGADPNGVNAALYTKNLKDAGMRVVLPGTSGQNYTYYLRVSSKNHATSGQYQLQVRLQEQPEVPGSTIQFADIRNATTAINVQGLPNSSPLTSTSAQVFDPALFATGGISNSTFDGAQDLGNLLTSDQNLISVSSQLVNASQVQWYKFTLNYDDVETILGGNDANKSWSTIFDIDYAGGTARPDLTLSVFDTLGNLIYISRNSNVVGDRPTPTASAQSNLSTGSSSPLDPFLGSVQLPVGASKTYYIAISSDAMLPTDLSQTFLPAANSYEALANPSLPTVPLPLSLQRMEPVNSVVRIVEDHLDPTVPPGTDGLGSLPLNPAGGYTTSDGSTVTPTTTSILPIQNTLISNPNTSQPGTVINALSANIMPYALADVPLFVNAFPSGGAPSNLYLVNAATGAVRSTIGALVHPGTNTITSTIAMRSDGILYGDQAKLGANDNGGILYAIDPTTGQQYEVGADGIPPTPTPLPNPPTFPPDNITTHQISAMTFQDIGLRTRIDGNSDHYIGYATVTDTGGHSHLFIMNPSTGNMAIQGDQIWGPVSSNFDGWIIPGDGSLYMNTLGDVGRVTGLAMVNRPGSVLEIPAGNQLQVGQFFSATDISKTVTFEFVAPSANVTDGTVLANGHVAVTFTPADAASTVATHVQNAIQNVTDPALRLSVVVQNGATFGGIPYLALIGAFGASGGNSPVIAISFSDLSGFGGFGTLGNLGDSMYGVTSSGQFISIAYNGGSLGGGLVTSINTFGNTGPQHQWAGLTLAPQNLDANGDGIGGDFVDCLFAITNNGDIYCIDTDANNGQGAIITTIRGTNFPIFPGGADHVSTGLANARGLAFSTVDYNLWHPTTQGAVDPGHGTYAAPDNSRDLGSHMLGTNTTAVAGGASYYFGFENFKNNNPASSPFHYIPYSQATFFGIGNQSSQYGQLLQGPQQVLSAYSPGNFQTGLGESNLPPVLANNDVLARNTIEGNNYNVPGGAHGDLITNTFSLSGYSANDLPTLYFNYLLDAGWNASANSGDDAAKVSVSTDGGLTWKVVASNQSSDMALYQSVFSNTGSSNSKQGTQFLFNAPLKFPDDPTSTEIIDTWRQARVDLSQFAGAASIKLKFSFVAGTGNNNHHGFAIDDIIVGLADRGEMVTQDPATLATPPTATNPIPPNTTFFQVPQNPVAGAPTQTLVGPYELTIRRGQQYAETLSGISPSIAIKQDELLTGNDRVERQYSLVAPGATGFGLNYALPAAVLLGGLDFAGADFFTINDGFGNLQRFEFDTSPTSLNLVTDFYPNGTHAANRIPISYTQLGVDVTSLAPLTDAQIHTLNQAIVDAINAKSSNSFRVTASLDATGRLIFLSPRAGFNGNPSVDLSNATFVDSTAQVNNHDTFSLSDGTYTRTFEFLTAGSTPTAGNVGITFAATDSPLTIATRVVQAINAQTSKTFGVSASIQGWTGSGSLPNGVASSNRIDLFGAQVVNMGTSNMSAIKFDDQGDVNPVRSQGVLIIANNNIRSSAAYGINVEPAKRDATNAQQQSAANLVQVNNSVNQVSTSIPQSPLFPGSKTFTFGLGLVPGIVIQNNIIDLAGTAGISFSGDADVDANGKLLPPAVVPFGRIVNNTIYGGGSGVGIAVSKNASPTLLNNILANLSLGVAVDGSSSSTVLGANLFQGNTQNTVGTGLGSFAATPPANAPLFVNAANHNFNLLETNSSGLPNQAIDSSLQTLADRTAMTTVNSPVGIGVINGIVVGSPITAPSIDETGKLRIADPNVQSSGGTGANVFIDRGALDRSDFTGPVAAMLNPADNSSVDQDSTLNTVLYGGAPLLNFQISLDDGNGSGIDNTTVTSAAFSLYLDVPTGQNPLNFPANKLTDGNQYVFTYDPINHIVRLTPTVGAWASAHTYTIVVANSGVNAVKDLSANPLLPTSTAPNTTGLTIFQVSIQQLNYGTAPAPFPTTLSQDGARHIVTSSGLYFGTSEPVLPDGSPNQNASAGQAGTGIVFGNLVPGTVGSVVVTTSKAGGFINAWIDWNGNGSWADAGDKFTFFSNPNLTGSPVTQLGAGTTTLYFAVPTTGQTTIYARFRISTTANLSYTGVAPDGEVEDYKVAIQPAAAYTVVLADPSSGQPLPIVNGNYVVLPGAQFMAKVYVTDTRGLGATGITSAFADLIRDNSVVTWNANSIVFNTDANSGFPNNESGTIVGGLVDEAGGTRSGAPTSPGLPQLVFTVTGTVSASTTLGTIVNIASAQATGAGHNTLVSGTGTAMSATYGSAHLIVPTALWQNPTSLYQDPNNNKIISPDVNNDGFVNLGDIINLIGVFNLVGSVDLHGPNFPIPLPGPNGAYVDVNGDGILNLSDLIAEVGYFNQFGSGPAPHLVSQAALQLVTGHQSVAPGSSVITADSVSVGHASALPAVSVATSAASPVAASVASPVATSAASAADSLFASDSVSSPLISPLSDKSDWTIGSVAQASVASQSSAALAAGTLSSSVGSSSSASARSQVFAAHAEDSTLWSLDEDEALVACTADDE